MVDVMNSGRHQSVDPAWLTAEIRLSEFGRFGDGSESWSKHVPLRN